MFQKNFFNFILLGAILIANGFMPPIKSNRAQLFKQYLISPKNIKSNVLFKRNIPLKDILGLGPAEIAISLIVALVLFGPETLKSLSKDVGRAAAELKEIPKTFKEGMDEGAESAQVSKMKAIAAEKRKKRDEKLAAEEAEESKVEAVDT
jgi:Sec-independent protein translocase protein TatA